MNSGDRFAGPDALARIAEALRGAPEVDLLFGGTVLELPSGRQLYRPPRAPEAHLCFGPPGYHQATAIRRQCHLGALYDLTLPVSADYGAVAGLLEQGARAHLLDHPVAIRGCGGHNLSERFTRQRFVDFVRVQRTVLHQEWPEVAVHLARLAAVHVGFRLWSLGRGGFSSASAHRSVAASGPRWTT